MIQLGTAHLQQTGIKTKNRCKWIIGINANEKKKYNLLFMVYNIIIIYIFYVISK